MEEKVLGLDKAIELLEKAIEKLEEKYEIELTGEEIIDEGEDIIGKEVIIKLCRKNEDIEINLGGWVELDRRIDEITEEPYIWFQGILEIDTRYDKNVKFGGGYYEDYRVFKAEYDLYENKWRGFWVENL